MFGIVTSPSGRGGDGGGGGGGDNDEGNKWLRGCG